MSMNKIECNQGRITLYGDQVLFHHDGVEFCLEENTGLPSYLKGNKKGNVFITARMIIFASSSSRDQLRSFSMPFEKVRHVEVKQPIFGANYIKGEISAELNGGWNGYATFKICFNSGGAIEFSQQFQRAIANARRPGGPQFPPPPPSSQPYTEGFYPPPTHVPVPPPAGYYPGPAYPPAPGMPQPPPYQEVPPPYHGPPYPGSVLQASAPPFAGMGPSAPPFAGMGPSAPPQDHYSSGSTGGAKAREAYSTGQNVYVPTDVPPPYAPPPYSHVDKKNQ